MPWETIRFYSLSLSARDTQNECEQAKVHTESARKRKTTTTATSKEVEEVKKNKNDEAPKKHSAPLETVDVEEEEVVEKETRKRYLNEETEKLNLQKKE